MAFSSSRGLEPAPARSIVSLSVTGDYPWISVTDAVDGSRVKEIEIVVRGMRLAARVWGPAEGRPVLALHGWLDNAASFNHLAPRLAQCRVVALDCPGHGLSQHAPAAGGYSFPDWIPLPFDVADALGWQTFTLLGHSMGAAIASLSAGVLYERVEKLVLLDALGPLTADDELAPSSLRRHLESRRFAERIATVYPDQCTAAQRLTRAIRGLSMQGAMVLVQRGTMAAPGGVAWRADPRLRLPSSLRLTELQVRSVLRCIRAPVLLVEPLNGYRFNTEIIAHRKICISDLTVINPAGGHHIHLDAPEEIMPAILEFLG